MFAYNHPLLTQGAGRIKTDPENEQRIATVLTRFQEWASKHSVALQYNITQEQVNRSRIIFPAAGLAIGVVSSYAFVRPGSKYIGKCFGLFTTYLGYQIHLRYAQAYKTSQYFGNFGVYPKDIQSMIDNNDSRYAFRWLKDDYLSIEK